MLHHRKERPLRFLPDGTGMGASINLPDGHLAPKVAYSRLLCLRLPWCEMENAGTLRDGLFPRALHCLVEYGVFGWRICSAGADTPPVFNL